MVTRILLAVVLVTGAIGVAVPGASAAPATAQCPVGVKVSSADSPVTVSVTDTSTSTPVDVVVTITGTSLTITAPQGASYELADASWCLKVSTKAVPLDGIGTTYTSQTLNKKDCAQSIGYVTVYSVTTASASCYHSSNEGTADFILSAPINTLHNTTLYDTDDGTCSNGGSSGLLTVVQGVDLAAADAVCVGLGAAFLGTTVLTFYSYNAPSDWYFC